MKKIFQRLPLGRGMDEEHEVHLKLVLELLKKEKLFVKFSKCEFWLQEVHFLGHVVNSNGIHVDPSKIEAVKNWKIAKPLTLLTQKNQKYEWQEHRDAFRKVTGENFVIYTDHKSLQHIFDQKELNMRQQRWIELFSDFDSEIRYHPRKENVVVEALSEASKVENATTKMLRGLDQLMERKEDRDRRMAWSACVDYLGSRWTGYIAILANITESLRDAIGYEYGLSSSNGWINYHLSIRCAMFEALYGRKCRSPVLWAKIDESRLIGSELVQETIDKEVLIKEKLKAARDHQKCYADNRRKPLEFEVGYQVLLKVSPWKGVIRIGKKGLECEHDTFHVSNSKKYLADAKLHVPLDEIKVDKTLHFVEEPVKIIDRRVKSLKRSKISIVKVRWNSKRGPEFTWEREDHMKANSLYRHHCVVMISILVTPRVSALAGCDINNEEITLVSVHDVNVSADEEVFVAEQDVVEEVVKVINTAKQIVDATTTTATTTTVDDITLAQALKEMKSTKPKKEKWLRNNEVFGSILLVSLIEALMKKLHDFEKNINTGFSDAHELQRKYAKGVTNKTQSKATPNESSSLGITSGGGPRCQETMGILLLKLGFCNEESLTARVESSDNEENLGEDASKQGRIDAIDADEEIILVSVQNMDEEMLDVNVLDGEEMFVAEQEVATNKENDEVNVVEEYCCDATTVSAATTTTATITTVDDITLAQALIEIKSTKPKEKGVVIQELGESTTTISSQLSSQQSHDKGKGILIEPVKHVKKKDLIRLDEEAALKLQAEFDEEERIAREKAKKEKEANIALIETWDDIQAKIDADHQLAERLQAQEQEELSIEEKATLFQQLLEKRRKHFAAKRAEEKRNKPPTKAQQRKIMCTYLKNMEGYKLKDLKLKEFDSIQEMFDRAFKRVNTFEDFRTRV
ncbi:putative reverse transcriptase domain-containing protein [Tanacetum coccineum]